MWSAEDNALTVVITYTFARADESEVMAPDNELQHTDSFLPQEPDTVQPQNPDEILSLQEVGAVTSDEEWSSMEPALSESGEKLTPAEPEAAEYSGDLSPENAESDPIQIFLREDLTAVDVSSEEEPYESD